MFPADPARPRLLAQGALLAAMAILVGGCGKSDLTSSTSPASTSPPHRAAAPARAPAPARVPAPAKAPAPPTVASVPLPLPLTGARAESFAQRVELHPVDVPGARIDHEAHGDKIEEREAARCGTATAALAGGRSPKLQRGEGLDEEDISSSVEVLQDRRAVESDLAYATSRAGLACYGRALRASLGREARGGVRLIGLRIGRVRVSMAGGQAGGIRVEATVGLKGSVVRLFIDALSFGYGPAEIGLYATSFVQPEPLRTEQELLTLLRERAELQRL